MRSDYAGGNITIYMKHKLIKLISVIITLAIVWQDAGRAQPVYCSYLRALSLAEKNGKDPDPEQDRARRLLDEIDGIVAGLKRDFSEGAGRINKKAKKAGLVLEVPVPIDIGKDRPAIIRRSVRVRGKIIIPSHDRANDIIRRIEGARMRIAALKFLPLPVIQHLHHFADTFSFNLRDVFENYFDRSEAYGADTALIRYQRVVDSANAELEELEKLIWRYGSYDARKPRRITEDVADKKVFRKTNADIICAILRPVAFAEGRAKREAQSFIKAIGDHTRTRRVWSGRSPRPATIRFFRDLQRRCQLALEGKFKEAGLPIYGYITDMHGRLSLWNRHMAEMEKRGVDIIVVDGDSMDRHEGGVRIMEDIMARSKRQRIVYNLGNHDIIFMRVMMGDLNSFRLWLAADNGGSSTLADAGVPAAAIDELMILVGNYGAAVAEVAQLFEARHQFLYSQAARTRIIHDDTRLIELATIMERTDRNMARLVNGFVITNDRLVNIFKWLRKNGRVYFTDTYDGFSIHGGVPVDAEGYPSLAFGDQRGLAAIEAVEGVVSQGSGLADVDRPGELLSECTWIRKFADGFKAKTKRQRLLEGVSALRIIHGHDPFDYVGRANTSFIGADIHGRAWVMAGPGGIYFVEGGRVVRKGALTGKKLLREVSEQCRLRLAQLERVPPPAKQTDRLSSPGADAMSSILRALAFRDKAQGQGAAPENMIDEHWKALSETEMARLRTQLTLKEAGFKVIPLRLNQISLAECGSLLKENLTEIPEIGDAVTFHLLYIIQNIFQRNCFPATVALRIQPTKNGICLEAAVLDSGQGFADSNGDGMPDIEEAVRPKRESYDGRGEEGAALFLAVTYFDEAEITSNNWMWIKGTAGVRRAPDTPRGAKIVVKKYISYETLEKVKFDDGAGQKEAAGQV